MKLKYIFFDWGYTLISKFNDVDDKIDEILEKYSLKWEDVFKKWKSYQLLNSLGRITEHEIYEDLLAILYATKQTIKELNIPMPNELYFYSI